MPPHQLILTTDYNKFEDKSKFSVKVPARTIRKDPMTEKWALGYSHMNPNLTIRENHNPNLMLDRKILCYLH